MNPENSSGIVIAEEADNAALAPLPEGIELTVAERAALSRMMEYTRKGSMPAVMVTRQQWVEDFLNRGFTELELIKSGRAPARLRITAPARKGRGGKAQFYEVQSAIEIAYVQKRHKALFGAKVTPDVAADVAPLAGLDAAGHAPVERAHVERFLAVAEAEEFVRGNALNGAKVNALPDGRAEVSYKWAMDSGPRPSKTNWYLLSDSRPYHGFYEEALGKDATARGPYSAADLAAMLGSTPEHLPRLALGIAEAEPVATDELTSLTAVVQSYYEAEEPSHPWGTMAAKMAGWILNRDADALRSFLGHGRGFNDSSKNVFFRRHLKQAVPSNIKAIHEAIDEWAGVGKEERKRRDSEAAKVSERKEAQRGLDAAALALRMLDVQLPDQTKQNAKDWLDGCFRDGLTQLVSVPGQGRAKPAKFYLANTAGRGVPLLRKEFVEYAKARVRMDQIDAPTPEREVSVATEGGAPLFEAGQRVIGTRGENAGRRMTVAEVRHNGSIPIYVMDGGQFLSADEIEAEPALAKPVVEQTAPVAPAVASGAEKMEVMKKALGDRLVIMRVGTESELAKVERAPVVAWIEQTFGRDVLNNHNKLALAKFLAGEEKAFTGTVTWKWAGGLKALGLWSEEMTEIDWTGLRAAFVEGRVVSPVPVESPFSSLVSQPAEAPAAAAESAAAQPAAPAAIAPEAPAPAAPAPVGPPEKPFAFMYDDAAEAEVYSEAAFGRMIETLRERDSSRLEFADQMAVRSILRRQGFPAEIVDADDAGKGGPSFVAAREKAAAFVSYGGARLVHLSKPDAWANSPARSADALGALIAALERPQTSLWADEVWRKVVEARGSKFKRSRPVGRELRDFMRAWLGEGHWATFLKIRAGKMEAAKAEAEIRSAIPDDPLARDWSYGRDETVTPAGNVTRVRANIEAIRVVKKLAAEGGRLATAEEREKLAKFNGWGGLKFVFNETPYEVRSLKEMHGANWAATAKQKLDREKADYKARYGYEPNYESSLESALKWHENTGRFADELRSVLTEDEFNAAAKSILNAHYTEEKVCHSLWDIARRAGFTGGRVLEPACGSGRILGAMPADLRAKSRVEAVELDPISAAITAALFPQTKVHACGFEEAILPVGGYDLVITNVPFHQVGPANQEGLGDVEFNLHNYFIAESMRKLKPGGVAVIITSSSTMEKNDAQRAALAKLGELHGAIRLPSDAFEGNAGTEVVTDILLMRKRDEKMTATEEDMTALSIVPIPEDQQATNAKGEPVTFTTINGYFARHPEQVLGVHSLKGKMYGKHSDKGGQYTVVTPKGVPPLDARLAEAIDNLPAGLMANTAAPELRATDSAGDVLMRDPNELPGSLVRRTRKEADGREVTTVYVVHPSGELVEAPWLLSGDAPEGSKTPAQATARALAFLDLRDALMEQVKIDLSNSTSDEQSAAGRAKLKQAYEKYVAAYGTLNDSRKALRALAPQDSTMGSVMALERVVELPREEGKRPRFRVDPMPIFTRRTLFPEAQAGRPENIEDAVSQSINLTGKVDLAYITEALGRDDAPQVAEEILAAGLAFRDHEAPDRLIPKASYLSGDVVTKVEACRRAVLLDSRLQASLAALEAVLPQPIGWNRIQSGLTFGETWTAPHLFTRFLTETYGAQFRTDPIYLPESHAWQWPEVENDRVYSPTAQSKIGTSRVKWSKVLMDALSKRPSAIYNEVEGKKYLDAEATEELRQRCVMIDTDFRQWAGKHADVQQEISDLFNAVFNRVVPFSDTGDKLTFPGLATGPGALVPREYQRKAVARFLQEPAGLVAHGTGFGKTLTAILLAHEHRRLGLSRKPLIVCDSANYVQFVQAFRAAYPQDNILVADDANFSPDERENFKAMVAYGEYDCVLMSRTQFEKVPVSAETEESWETEELQALRDAVDMADEGTASARKAQDALYRKEQQIEKRTRKLREIRDRGLTWEQLGVDLLIVDECHRHKKTGFATAFGDVKGIDAGESRRGRDLLMKARFIQERRNGRGVIGLSGTPATNTMAEFWTMNRIFAPNTLEQFGVEYFDDFMTAFCEVEKRLEMNEANGKHRYVDRLCKFRKVGVLREFVQAGADVQLDSTKLNLTLPKHERGEGAELAVVPITDAVLDEMDQLAAYYEVFEQATGKEKRELSWVPITLMQLGMAASIDPRLVNPAAPDDPGSLANKVTENVAEIYHATAAGRKTQCVFLDRYRAADTTILNRLGRRGSAIKASDLITALEVDDEPAANAADPADLDDPENAAGAAEEVEVGGRFNLYEDIKRKLIAKGVKAEEIAFIGDAKTPAERAALFARVNAGTIRVIIGSSDKMGIGANFQERLYAAHNFDPPRNMTPDQQEQRDGRIIRSGNTNEAVRVILYGMQDTVTPAIINRIQTKRQFIRAGFFGEGDEMEDVGDVRLDEFQAALVPDKRQLKLADLNGQIKDCTLAINVAYNRVENYRSSIASRESRLEWLRSKKLADAEKANAWIKGNTRPITAESELVIDLTGVEREIRNSLNAPKAAKEWFEKEKAAAEPLVLRGTYAEVEKILGKMIDTLKTAKLDFGHEKLQLGAAVVNGMTVRIVYAKYQTMSGNEGEGLLASVLNPVGQGSEDNSHFAKHVKFASPMMFLSIVGNVPGQVDAQVRGTHMEIKQTEEELASLREELAKAPRPTEAEAKLEALKAELAALKADMVKNPFVRGANRRKGAQETAAATQAMPAAEPSVDAGKEGRAATAEERRGDWIEKQPDKIAARDIAMSDWEKLMLDVDLKRRGLTLQTAEAMVRSAVASQIITREVGDNMIAKIQPPAPAAASKPLLAPGERPLGKNASGEEVFEDAKGRRFVLEQSSGQTFRLSESMRMGYGGDRQPVWTPSPRAGGRFETVEEASAGKASTPSEQATERKPVLDRHAFIEGWGSRDNDAIIRSLRHDPIWCGAVLKALGREPAKAAQYDEVLTATRERAALSSSSGQQFAAAIYDEASALGRLRRLAEATASAEAETVRTPAGRPSGQQGALPAPGVATPQVRARR